MDEDAVVIEPVEPPDPPRSVATAGESPEPGFDRDRLVSLVDRLERDIALVESAMDDIERHDEQSLDAALAALAD